LGIGNSADVLHPRTVMIISGFSRPAYSDLPRQARTNFCEWQQIPRTKGAEITVVSGQGAAAHRKLAVSMRQTGLRQPN